MNKTLFLVAGLLSVVQPAVADRQDAFVQKFNHLLYHPYVRYHQGKVDILYKLSALEMTLLGLCGAGATYGCAISPDVAARVVCGGIATISFGAMAYKMWKVYNHVPCLTFSEQGLQTDSSFLFNWGQVEDIKIEEVFDQVYTGHGFQPVDGYQFNTGGVSQQYAGRSLVVYGKHKTRLWAVDERTHWMPVPLNDLIDLLQFFRDRYGKR
jgi:hypothetical protein